MAPKSVPSKIVIAGNSKMSLNERFSSIPRPKPPPIQKAPKFTPKRVYQHMEYEEPVEYVPKPFIRRPRQVFHQRHVPIQNRVSFVKTVPVHRGFVPRHHQHHNNYNNNNFNRNPQHFKKPFRPNFNQQNRKAFNNRQNNNFKTFPNAPKKKSLAELDRELDDYMRKSKHPPITI